jgi:hypothetical protein
VAENYNIVCNGVDISDATQTLQRWMVCVTNWCKRQNSMMREKEKKGNTTDNGQSNEQRHRCNGKCRTWRN